MTFQQACDAMVSPPSVDGPLESPSSVCPSICPSVRMYVTRYLVDRSLLFPETWQLGRTWIGDKNVPSRFLNSALNPL